MIDTEIINSIEKLSSFRNKCIDFINEELIFSDSLWFATWSKNSSGDMVARYLLKEISFRKFFLFFLKKIIFNYLRCFFFRRELSFSRIGNNAKKKYIYQTWIDLNQNEKINLAGKDKYFSNFFSEHYETNTALSIIIASTPKQVKQNELNQDSIILSVGNLRCVGLSAFFIILKQLFYTLINFLVRFKASNFNEFFCGLFVALNVIDIRQNNSVKIYRHINSFLKSYLKEHNMVPDLFLPYEAQPEQTALIKAWQKNGGKVIGYIHSTLLTFPGHYIKLHKYFPDQLWVHGTSYKKVLTIFGWKETEIKEIKSLRYSSLAPINIKLSTIALPYSTADLNYSIYVLKKLSKTGIKLRHIRPHPLTGISRRDSKLFNNIINKNISTKEDYKIQNAIVCIGPASLPLEVLEQKVNCTVIHIPISRSFIDRFDNSLWDDYIEFIKLDEAVRMSLKANGAFICV